MKDSHYFITSNGHHAIVIRKVIHGQDGWLYELNGGNIASGSYVWVGLARSRAFRDSFALNPNWDGKGREITKKWFHRTIVCPVTGKTCSMYNKFMSMMYGKSYDGQCDYGNGKNGKL